MRPLLVLAVLIVCLGCASKPAPKDEVARACIAERVGVLANEWVRFESVSSERVFYPDWRSMVRQWAWVECSRGHPVSEFHPDNTATARRHY